RPKLSLREIRISMTQIKSEDVPLRAAVIGVGHLGRFHAQKYKAVKSADLVGLYDASPARSQEISKELDVPAWASLEDLVGKVDLVTVASTTSSHYEVCRFLIENGIHVHVEKPLASNSQEGEELCALAKKHNVKLQVGHVERFNA